MNQAEMENSLRALLAQRAERAQFHDDLAEKIIIQATTGTPTRLDPHRPRMAGPSGPRRRPWTLQLMVAAAVVALVAGGISYLSLNGSSNGKPLSLPKTNTPTQTPTQTTSHVPTSTATQPVTTAPPPLQSNGTYVGVQSTLDNGARLVHLNAFKALDLTFVGSNVWAMGSATCFATGTGRCSLLVHSTDGVHWSMLRPTPFNVADDTAGCATYCVDHIRFATPQVGYLYGPDTLLMTTNAGRSWKAQAGGASALETLDGNVIRVSGQPDCLPSCTYTVQIAPVGSTNWQTVPLPGSYLGNGVTLARTGSSAYLMTYGHTAGGGSSAKSTLFVSSNDGTSWTNRGEVCGQNPGSQGEVDGSSMTGGSDGSIEVLCQPRTPNGTDSAWVTISTDGGKTFHPTPGLLDAANPGLVGAGTANDFCVQSSKQLSCTRDGGATYAAAHLSGKGPKHAVWLGFENQTDGRALEIIGSGTGLSSNLWTTRDGGVSWSLTVGIG